MGIFKFRNLKTGQATPIPPGDFTVGRADDAYVHLEDSSVSRHHAKICNEEEGIFVEDLGSANGTAAHGAFITGRKQVEFGDVIHVGSVPFRIDPEVAGEPAAAPSAGLRAVQRSYMKRDTEKLSVRDGTIQAAATPAPETHSVPKVSDVPGMDTVALGAPAPLTAAPAKLPLIRPGGTPLPGTARSPAAAPAASPLPLQQPVPPISQPQMELARQLQPASPEPAPVLIESEPAKPQEVAAPEPDPEPEPDQAPQGTSPTSVGWGWLLIIFLAGMGVGLFLGLYFANFYFEMGTKAHGLP